MDRSLGVVLLLLCGIAIGAGGSQAWGWYRYTTAINAELDGRAQRDALVAALVVAQGERVKAQQTARASRQGIYAQDQGAKAWAAQPVPDVLAKRVRDAARAAQSAASATSSTGLSESP
jgi:hypothetical protein